MMANDCEYNTKSISESKHAVLKTKKKKKKLTNLLTELEARSHASAAFPFGRKQNLLADTASELKAGTEFSL